MTFVPCQEFHIPQNWVANRLQGNDKEQCVTGLFDIFARHDQDGAWQLNGHVEKDEHDGEEPATTPDRFCLNI